MSIVELLQVTLIGGAWLTAIVLVLLFFAGVALKLTEPKR